MLIRTKDLIQKDYRGTLKGRLVSIFNSAKSRAKKKELDFNITPEDLLELYYQQDGKCAITNLKMEFKTGPRHRANTFIVSLDRKNSEKGYTKDNIQFLCWQVNKMKSSLTEIEFIFWIRIISSRVL